MFLNSFLILKIKCCQPIKIKTGSIIIIIYLKY